jgi:hypothetical protein
MERTTREQLETQLKLLCKFTGRPYGHYLKNTDGTIKQLPRGLALNCLNNGTKYRFQIQAINETNTGVNCPFGEGRLTINEMYRFLYGINSGFYSKILTERKG